MLEDQVKYVDATKFVRDPLYQEFIDAITRVNMESPQQSSLAELTAEEKREKTELAKAIIRDLMDKAKNEEKDPLARIDEGL